ncbi:hypothetical protein HAX54_045464, partial [Datura stramonium]|nr:hypothetical protein [Datura stramonium]
GRAPRPCCSARKAAPHACHRATSAPHRALSLVGRPAPRAWNRATQGSRCASSSAARPVPRASGRAAMAVECEFERYQPLGARDICMVNVEQGVGKVAEHAIAASPKRKKAKSAWVK